MAQTFTSGTSILGYSGTGTTSSGTPHVTIGSPVYSSGNWGYVAGDYLTPINNLTISSINQNAIMQSNIT